MLAANYKPCWQLITSHVGSFDPKHGGASVSSTPLLSVQGHWKAYVKYAGLWWNVDSGGMENAVLRNPFHSQSAQEKIMILSMK